jgi:hypothetical protein
MSDDLISKKKEIEKKYKEQLQKTIFNEEKGEESKELNKSNLKNNLVNIIAAISISFIYTIATLSYLDIISILANIFAIQVISFIITSLIGIFSPQMKFTSVFMKITFFICILAYLGRDTII